MCTCNTRIFSVAFMLCYLYAHWTYTLHVQHVIRDPFVDKRWGTLRNKWSLVDQAIPLIYVHIAKFLFFLHLFSDSRMDIIHDLLRLYVDLFNSCCITELQYIHYTLYRLCKILFEYLSNLLQHLRHVEYWNNLK